MEVEEFTHTSGSAYLDRKDKWEATWRTPIADREYGLFSENGIYTRRATQRMLSSFNAFQKTKGAAIDSGQA